MTPAAEMDHLCFCLRFRATARNANSRMEGLFHCNEAAEIEASLAQVRQAVARGSEFLEHDVIDVYVRLLPVLRIRLGVGFVGDCIQTSTDEESVHVHLRRLAATPEHFDQMLVSGKKRHFWPINIWYFVRSPIMQLRKELE